MLPKHKQIQLFLLPMSHSPVELFAKALVDNYNLDAFKHGTKDPNSVHGWSYHIHIYNYKGVSADYLIKFRFRSDSE